MDIKRVSTCFVSSPEVFQMSLLLTFEIPRPFSLSARGSVLLVKDLSSETGSTISFE